MAKEVRTRLEPAAKVELVMIEGGAGRSNDPLDELSYGRTVRSHLRDFGGLFGAIAFAIGAYQVFHGKAFYDSLLWVALGAILAIAGYSAPRVLRPLWRGWMGFAHVLGLVMTTVILCVTWVGLMIPFALVLRAVKRRVMDTSFKTGVDSYWESTGIERTDFSTLERQF